MAGELVVVLVDTVARSHFDRPPGPLLDGEGGSTI
jgi:hypothetical protein